MTNNPKPEQPDQHFSDAERLFRRVRRANIARSGKATFLAFKLPDMSVNREQASNADDARKGFDKAEWAVVAFSVKDIPPRATWIQNVQEYQLKPRHVPEPGTFSHGEVRVWRKLQAVFTLITSRKPEDFLPGDPDRSEPRDTPETLLDPDFHMRWRKHIELAAKMVLPCDSQPA